MPRMIETAVAAAATESLRRQLTHVLAETDIRLLAMPRDGVRALAALEDCRPDLLITDAQLPAMEGSALARRALCTSRLSVRPAVILLYDAQFLLPERHSLASIGAHFLEKPLCADAFAETIQTMRNERPVFPEGQQRRVDQLLDELGVPTHAGRNCLRTAALLCASDERYLYKLSASLYPRTGELCGMNASQVERAMRHAIDLAWQSDKMDNQYRIFADTVDAGRGQPACSEMISRLADILRLEG